MNSNSTLDGVLVQWGERLFYPRNRIVKVPPAYLGGRPRTRPTSSAAASRPPCAARRR